MKKAGKETPLDHFPVLDSIEEWYLNLYSKLSTQRNFNGYLQVSEVISYCKQIELIDSLINVVDNLVEIDNEVKALQRDGK